MLRLHLETPARKAFAECPRKVKRWQGKTKDNMDTNHVAKSKQHRNHSGSFKANQCIKRVIETDTLEQLT